MVNVVLFVVVIVFGYLGVLLHEVWHLTAMWILQADNITFGWTKTGVVPRFYVQCTRFGDWREAAIALAPQLAATLWIALTLYAAYTMKWSVEVSAALLAMYVVSGLVGSTLDYRHVSRVLTEG